MERLKNMSIRRAYFLLTLGCLLLSLLLALAVWGALGIIRSSYPTGGVSFGLDGTTISLEQPTPKQARVIAILDGVRMAVWAVFPFAGLGIAGILFYCWKLEKPIAVLLDGTQRISRQELEFSIPEISRDELGQVCAAFETMRMELLKANQELWRQAEEQKRLNAAFAHDLRNPVTVLLGTVKLLRQDTHDPQAMERLETYTRRIGEYAEAMSGIQRLEQMPLRAGEVSLATLRAELEETACLLAPTLAAEITCPGSGSVNLDHGIFLTVAENLINNSARFASQKIKIEVSLSGGFLVLTAADDGPGYPAGLLQNGPRPFDKTEGAAGHFGMGLYSSALLCGKHGGALKLCNDSGAVTTAVFQLY